MKVYSIFRSVDGEVNFLGQGRLTTFIRLYGCNLHCSYCDTRYATESGKYIEMSPIEVLEEIRNMKGDAIKVTITGGEPLLQADEVKFLVELLVGDGYFVTIETNGSFPLIEFTPDVRRAVGWVLDYKLPSSGMHNKMITTAFTGLTDRDWVKFVIKDENDFNYALRVQSMIQELSPGFINFAYSPVQSTEGGIYTATVSPAELVEWLKEKGGGFEVINLQIHKVIFLQEEVKW